MYKKRSSPPVPQSSAELVSTTEGWRQTAEKYWFDTCHRCFVNTPSIFLPQYRNIAASCRSAATLTNSSKRLLLAGRVGNTFRINQFCINVDERIVVLPNEWRWLGEQAPDRSRPFPHADSGSGFLMPCCSRCCSGRQRWAWGGGSGVGDRAAPVPRQTRPLWGGS